MTHDETVLLLPWYVNGTLTASERSVVEQHVAECTRCTDEVRLLQEVAAEMARQRASEPVPSADRLEGVLAQIRSAKVQPIETHQRRGGARGVSRWQSIPRFARLALAAQVLLVLGLGAWIAGLYSDRGVRTAAGGDTDAARIAIAFQPGVTEELLRRTIQGLDGTIVAGPSALGLYTLVLDLPADSVAAVDRLLDNLRRDRGVVRVAERAP